jgi:hypothetical protein
MKLATIDPEAGMYPDCTPDPASACNGHCERPIVLVFMVPFPMDVLSAFEISSVDAARARHSDRERAYP